MAAALIIAVAVCSVLTTLHRSYDAWGPLFTLQFETDQTAEADITPAPPPPPPPPYGECLNITSAACKQAVCRLLETCSPETSFQS